MICPVCGRKFSFFKSGDIYCSSECTEKAEKELKDLLGCAEKAEKELEDLLECMEKAEMDEDDSKQ